MTLEEIIAAARERADDRVATPLWSDEDWIRFANDAENEACRRGRLIVDSTTTSITTISMTAGTPVFSLDPKILFIRRARLVGRPQMLGRASSHDLDCAIPDWEDEVGDTRLYVPDMDSAKFRPYPIPSEAGVVKLTVVRLPLNPMVNDSDKPEIPAHLHESLVFWMLYKAFSRPDAETQDKKKAEESLAFFEQEFGKKSSAVDEAWIAREHGFTPEEGVF